MENWRQGFIQVSRIPTPYFPRRVLCPSDMLPGGNLYTKSQIADFVSFSDLLEGQYKEETTPAYSKFCHRLC